MPTRTFTETICDAPKCEVDPVQKRIETNLKYVNAMTYGATFHITCFQKLTAVQLCKALGLDEVEVDQEGDRDIRERVWTALA